MTFGERFVKEHFVFDLDKQGEPHKAYLVITGVPESVCRDPKILLLPGVDKQFKADLNDHAISFQTSVKYSRALANVKDNVPRLFIFLNQLFKEEAIRTFFPRVWSKHHNVHVRKASTHARQMANRERNLHGKPKVDQVHRDCVYATHNMTIREAAERSRNF